MAFAFSFSGTEYRLTQTGTDANLTGVATAVTGVATVARSTAYTTTTIRKPPTKNGMWYRCSVAGTTSATAPTFGLTVGSSTVDGGVTWIAFREPEIYTMGNVTVYEVPEATLYVNGTLTIDPRVNLLSSLNNIYPMGGSTLNCGVQFTSTFGGGTLYSKGVALRFRGGFQPQPSSTWNLRGATMHSTSTTQQAHEFKGSATIRDGVFLGEINLNSRLRLNQAALDIDGFYVYGLQMDMLMTPTAGTIVKNVRSINVGVGFDNAFVNGAGITTPFVFDGVPSTTGNVSTGFSNWMGMNDIQLLNCENGSLEMIMPDNCGNATTSGMGGRIYQKYQVKVQDTLSADIPSAITYLKDTNNGKRKIKNIKSNTPLNNTADQVQILTTDLSGLTPITQVLTAYIYRNNTVLDIGAPDGNEIRDLRGKIDTAGSDLFDVTVFEYDYAITSIVDIAMKGLSNVVSSTKMLADENVTLTKTAANVKLASSFTINPTTKVVTVTANSTYDDLYDIIKAYKCTATQVNLETPTLDKLIVNPSGSNLTAYTGWSLVVNTGVTLSAGTKFTYVYFPTITLNGTGKITGVYASTAGTSTTWEFQSVEVGTSLAIYDGSGVTKYFQGEVTMAGTYRYYIPPMATGVPYTYAIEKYGTRRETGSFPSNAGGVLFYVPSYAEDVGISQTTQATVAAYTAIDNEDKFYDYTAYKRLSESFIKLGQLTTRDGTKLVVDAGYSVIVNQSAASVESVSGSTITIKSTSYGGGSKYTTTKLTPPATFTANSTEVISGNIEDGNGDSSLTIVGGDDLGYELWKVTTSTATNDYATGTLLNDTILKGQKYRFIGISGYDIVGIDTNSNVRRRSSMAYGVYTQSFYVGDQIQLADDAPSLQALTTEIQILKVSVEAMPTDFLAEPVETGATVAQSLRLANSVLGGKVSGAGTGTETFRDLADTKDRVISTVTPEGNRTAETYDLD
jgi:hypothetical protein